MDAQYEKFIQMTLRDKVLELYREGTILMSIRYYGYKINLYTMHGALIEVFYNHKFDRIERIEKLDSAHTRMKFYTDQIKIEGNRLVV